MRPPGYFKSSRVFNENSYNSTIAPFRLGPYQFILLFRKIWEHKNGKTETALSLRLNHFVPPVFSSTTSKLSTPLSISAGQIILTPIYAPNSLQYLFHFLWVVASNMILMNALTLLSTAPDEYNNETDNSLQPLPQRSNNSTRPAERETHTGVSVFS